MEKERKLFRRSKKWQAYRKAVYARCGGICEYCCCRDMKAVHHRIDKRLGPDLFSDYENPILVDLMGVCEDCHNFIHLEHYSKDCAPKFHPDSLALSGDNGFTSLDEPPGHWIV